MDSLVPYLGSGAFLVKATSALLLAYGLVAIPLARRAKSEDGATLHVLAGGSSLAMGMLVFGFALIQTLAGGVA